MQHSNTALFTPEESAFHLEGEGALLKPEVARTAAE